MAEKSSFFNSYKGDRLYTAGEFVDYFATFIGNGVFFGGTSLKVAAVAPMDVSVETGKAWINGYCYQNADAPKQISVEPSHPTLGRIDRVVLRLDLAQNMRTITALVKKGAETNAPVPPTLQRDVAAWELGLADIRVNAGAVTLAQSNITDLRLSPDLCGVVVGLVDQPNLGEIFNQYQSKYKEVETQWAQWMDTSNGNWNTFQGKFDGWSQQVKAEVYANASASFDDWGKRGGYDYVTQFLANGNIEESLTNRLSGNLFATKTTAFSQDGTVTELVTFTDPPLETCKVTTFTDATVKEVVS